MRSGSGNDALDLSQEKSGTKNQKQKEKNNTLFFEFY